MQSHGRGLAQSGEGAGYVLVTHQGAAPAWCMLMRAQAKLAVGSAVTYVLPARCMRLSCSSSGTPAPPNQHTAMYDEDEGLEVVTLDEPKIRPGMLDDRKGTCRHPNHVERAAVLLSCDCHSAAVRCVHLIKPSALRSCSGLEHTRHGVLLSVLRRHGIFAAVQRWPAQHTRPQAATGSGRGRVELVPLPAPPCASRLARHGAVLHRAHQGWHGQVTHVSGFKLLCV